MDPDQNVILLHLIVFNARSLCGHNPTSLGRGRRDNFLLLESERKVEVALHQGEHPVGERAPGGLEGRIDALRRLRRSRAYGRRERSRPPSQAPSRTAG